jgi:thymidylate kinase
MLLIILRGPAGSGKSDVCCGLRKKIKNEKSIKIYFLNLDETDKESFEKNMNETLECEYVISEMFSGNDEMSPGNGHTTNPESWIVRFKKKNYYIFSFILKASIETCLKRCRNDNKNKRSSVYQEYDQHRIDHNLFYKDLNFVNFGTKANIYEETIDTETKSIPEVVDIIFSKINSYLD